MKILIKSEHGLIIAFENELPIIYAMKDFDSSEEPFGGTETWSSMEFSEYGEIFSILKKNFGSTINAINEKQVGIYIEYDNYHEMVVELSKLTSLGIDNGSDFEITKD